MSMERRCDIWKATDGQWYIILGQWEYSYDDHECACHGPFESEKALEDWRFQFGGPNPGGGNWDDSGTVAPPDFERYI